MGRLATCCLMILAFLPCAMTQPSRQPRPRTVPASRPIVGAIRWDAWHGDRSEPGKAVQKSLGPRKYHFRLPFFAKVLPNGTVRIRGDSQPVMDREIAYAKAAGIDYWAFVTYEPGTAMALGLKHYLASKHRADVKFCLTTEQARWGTPGTSPKIVERFVRLLAEPTYQKVLDGRPLLYLGFIDEGWTRKHWGSMKAFRQAVDRFRAAVVRAGGKDPYIVVMAFDARQAAAQAKAFGCDAISAYAIFGGSKAGTPFAASRRKTAAFWNACKATATPVVPIVSFGWDPRPRVDNPVPWTRPGPNHYRTATPAELAAHVTDALDWTARNLQAARANAVVIYAWNENDEGGWLVPTLSPDGSPNVQRVTAVGKAIRAWRRPAAATAPTGGQ